MWSADRKSSARADFLRLNLRSRLLRLRYHGGISVSAGINKGKGHENSDSLSHTETQVTAGNHVTLVSGRDTTLTGAQVSGESIKADVGRNLTLTSQQDSATYDAQQKNSSAGASFSFGSMSGSASINMSRDRMHSDYQSVQEQTGLLAGKGGFDITVGGHTQLNGAVTGDGRGGGPDGKWRDDGGGAVPASGGHRKRKLPPAPPCDVGPPQRGEYAALHAGKHPGVAGGTCFNPSGGAGGR